MSIDRLEKILDDIYKRQKPKEKNIKVNIDSYLESRIICEGLD